MWAENWEDVSLLGGVWSPSNTLWPEPRPTFVPSGILIHPVVRSQQTWPKIGDTVPLGGSWVELGPHLTQCDLKLISYTPNKTCQHDPLPTWLVKDMSKLILPFIALLVNKSLSAAVFQDPSYNHC